MLQNANQLTCHYKSQRLLVIHCNKLPLCLIAFKINHLQLFSHTVYVTLPINCKTVKDKYIIIIRMKDHLLNKMCASIQLNTCV